MISESQDLRGPVRPATMALAALGSAALLLVCPSVSRAQAEAGKAAAVGKDYALAHKSVYTPIGSPRSPFWPIGWAPTAVPITEAAVVASAVKPEDFVVTSISMDYPPLAVINKRTYSVGDRVPIGGGTPATTLAPASGGDTVTVRQISDGVVVLDHHGKLMRVMTSTPSMSGTKKTP